VFLCAALWLLAARAPAAEPWPAYLHDNQRTGRTPLAIDALTLGVAPAWSAPTGYSIPLVVGERVYAMRSQFGIGDDVTTVAAFDLRTGAVLWDESQNLIFPSALAYADGLVVYAGMDGDSFETLLWVRNAETGELVYPVAIESLFVTLPVLDRDPETDGLVAYLSSPASTNFGSGPSMEAVALGPSSGSVLWKDPYLRGAGGAIPTIVEDSVVIAGDEFLAYDRTTGEMFQFHHTGYSGALVSTVAYDAARRQLYVTSMESTVDSMHALTAYHYVDGDTIDFVWQETGPGVGLKTGPAIDDEGYVWTALYDTLVKRDPATGDVVDTGPDATPGSFAIGMTPIVSDGLVWTFEGPESGDTVAYDQATLEEVRRLPGSRGDLNSDFNAPGAIAPGAFLLDYGRTWDERGFSVFVPEPSGRLAAPAALLLVAALARRWAPKRAGA
jgi:outer membrane protein assembly factor BamB